MRIPNYYSQKIIIDIENVRKISSFPSHSPPPGSPTERMESIKQMVHSLMVFLVCLTCCIYF